MADHITRRVFIGSTGLAAVTSRLHLHAGAAPRLPRVERRTLHAAMDVIMPGEGRMPAASAVNGVAYIEAVAEGDGEFRALLLKGLHALGTDFAGNSSEQQIAALTSLERNDPVAFAALRDAVYEAYYTNPKIWALLGYRFRRGRSRTATLEAFDERQLVRVRQMPRLYRDVG